MTGCRERKPINPGYHEYAYVSNGKSDSVSVIDVLSLRNIKTIAVGKNPTGVAANPKKNEIYVANTESNNITVIDAERNQVVSTIGVYRAPYFVSVSADGKRAYVANSGSSNVSVLDL
ncbi:MAG: beta-propeller fold lactonase family protein, partial [Candidatus Korobacteraceae bacterium]